MTGESGTAGPAVRARNPWGQGDRLRAEILTAAARLLSELGTAEGLTLRGVARMAGVAPASIYAHFADKSDLIAALLAYEHERVMTVLTEAAAGAVADPADPVGAVRAQLLAFCQYSLASPGHYRVLFGGRIGPPGQQRGYGRLLVQRFAATLSAAEEAGARLRLPAERAAIVLLVGAHGRVAFIHSQPEPDAEQRVTQFVDDLVGLVFDRP